MRPVSPQIVHAAQMLTGLSMAAFLVAGWVPGVRRYGGTLRVGILAVFLIGCVALTVAAFW